MSSWPRVRTFARSLSASKRPSSPFNYLKRLVDKPAVLSSLFIPSRWLLDMDGAETATTSELKRANIGGEVEGSIEKRRKIAEEDDKGLASDPKTSTPDPKAQSKAKGSRRTARNLREQARKMGTRRGTRPDDVEGGRSEDSGESKGSRLPKRQCALLIGFCGSAYNGMQMCVTFVPRLESWSLEHSQ